MSCQLGSPPKQFIGTVKPRPWRTNIGLRLTKEVGEWLEQRCATENRTFANYVETLILQDRERARRIRLTAANAPLEPRRER